jgi:polar amino acid transport system permease protein
VSNDSGAIHTPPPIKAVPVRHPGRWAGIAVVAVLAAMLINSFFQNPQYKWRTQWHYAFTRPILDGLVTTLELTAAAMLIGVVGGVAVAVARLSPNPVLSSASWLYVWVFRGTPVLVQIVMWFNIAFLLPHISIGIPFGPELVTFKTNSLISGFTAAVLALGLNEAAYMSEIVRAGLLSVDEGQTEAAGALGMSNSLTMRRIVLPQAMRFIVPPTGNETISMLKTSSLASVIALANPELFQQGQSIINATYITVPILIMISLWYLAMTSILTVGQFYVERYYGRGAYRYTQRATLAERLWRALRYRRPYEHAGSQELDNPPPPFSSGSIHR